MPILVFKLLLTPLLVAGITYASRRWGPVIAGCLIALPISGGPITMFITIEQGLVFGTAVAASNLMGMSAVAVFCFAYIHTARFGALVAAPTAAGSFLLAVHLFSYLHLSVPAAAILGCVLLGISCLGGNGNEKPKPHNAHKWDIPVRIIAATGLLLGLTAAAQNLGPVLSGLLGVFPVFTLVIAVFTHQEHGSSDARKLMRGVAFGCYCSMAFYVILPLSLPRLGLWPAFLLASLACVAINLLLMKIAPRFGIKR
ncbi:MAG: hypothetical protein LBV80_02330 [Deltaproteobacteria bacterium]|jgi:hypothetical protein|nr:hypothetical protein [Deltaproteobacteria bacterium]